MPQLDAEDLSRLTDIVTYGERALRHLGGMPLDAFLTDEKTFDSVIRCIQVVGEAAWKVSKSVQAAHPEVPWLQVAGMRHRLVHDYGEVDPAIAYRTATTHLPGLVALVRAIVASAQVDF